MVQKLNNATERNFYTLECQKDDPNTEECLCYLCILENFDNENTLTNKKLISTSTSNKSNLTKS